MAFSRSISDFSSLMTLTLESSLTIGLLMMDLALLAYLSVLRVSP